MRKNIKILIVDDEPALLSLASSILQEEGYKVVQALSGEEALSKARTEHPDIVLLDVVLGDIDGIEVCKTIKADPFLKDIYVILISGKKICKQFEVEALEYGADGYIVKPIDRQELLARIHAMARLKTVESELRIQKKWLHGILSGLAEAVIAIDPHECITFVNAAFEKLTGFSQKEAVGKELAAIFRITNPSLHEIIQTVYSCNKQDYFRFSDAVLTTFDGQELFINLTVSPVCDKNGEVIGGLIAFQDISDRKRAEAELLKAHETLEKRVVDQTSKLLMINEALQRNSYLQSIINDLLRLSLRNMSLESLLNHTLDLLLSIQWFSHSVACIFLVEEEPEILVLKVCRGFSEEHRACCSKIPFGKCICGRAASSRQVVFANCNDEEHEIKNNNMFPHSHYGVPILSGDRVLGVLDLYVKPDHVRLEKEEEFLITVANTLAGIIERKQALNALYSSKERYRGLVENARDIIFTLSPDGIITSLNPAFEDITGYSCADWLNKSYIPIVHPEDIPTAVSILQQTLKGEIKPLFELRIKSKSQDYKILEFTLTPQFDQDKIVNILGIGRNIMERKNLENQLFQAQKLEAIGTLASGIAHDFNNILTAIMGYTEMTKLKVPAPFVQNNLQEVLNASKRAKDLVNQILAFSRQSKQEWKPLIVYPIIKEALKLIRASIPTTIEIRYNITSTETSILGDPGQIHQVVMNLCINAAQAMNEKGGVLQVELIPWYFDSRDAVSYSDVPQSKYLRLSVRDTGYGMEHHVLERIFEPFFTTKKPEQGTGMGLAVVHGIVKRHNGIIKVESKPLVGTTFHIFFPVIESHTEFVIDQPIARTGGKERILFVDDEVSIVQMWKQTLELIGYEVDARANSLDALNIFSLHPEKFDLLITDQTMPNMTGIELAEKIIAIRPGIPVILYSGYNKEVTPEKVKSLGIREYLVKPVALFEMSNVIQQVLNRQSK